MQNLHVILRHSQINNVTPWGSISPLRERLYQKEIEQAEKQLLRNVRRTDTGYDISWPCQGNRKLQDGEAWEWSSVLANTVHICTATEKPTEALLLTLGDEKLCLFLHRCMSFWQPLIRPTSSHFDGKSNCFRNFGVDMKYEGWSLKRLPQSLTSFCTWSAGVLGFTGLAVADSWLKTWVFSAKKHAIASFISRHKRR